MGRDLSLPAMVQAPDGGASIFRESMSSGLFSVFHDVRHVTQGIVRDLPWVVERLKSKEAHDRILPVRQAKAAGRKEEHAKLKAGLKSYVFAGTFRKRSASGIIEHSGYMVVDFDHVQDMAALRATLEADPYTCLLFTSPSGDGLKVVVRVPPNAKEHSARFEALMDYYSIDEFDPKNSDVCRVCFESYDPEPYYNPSSKVFEEIAQFRPIDLSASRPAVRLHSDDAVISKLVAWSERKFPIVEGQRNNNLFRLAGAMNRFGVAQVTASTFLAGYVSEGFDRKEIEQAVKSAYKDLSAHGTQAFNDDDTEAFIRQAKADGMAFEDISKAIESKLPNPQERKETIEAITDDVDATFWIYKKNGSITIDHYRFKLFLKEFGYYKYYPSDSTGYTYVQVEFNLVRNVSEKIIKDFVLGYVERTGNRQLFNAVAGRSTMFMDNYLSMIDPIGLGFVTDTTDHGTLFFRNCAVRVHRSGKVEQIDYADLGGYVWEDHVLDRDFTRGSSVGDFATFVDLISARDPERIKSHRSTLGCLLHGFKRMKDNRAVIYNDAVINSNPNGGSGKGILCQSIGHMRRVSIIDGKSFSFDKGFPYQTVTSDCQVLVFDDVPKKFNFERLFSVITEGLVLEKKNKDAIKLPVSKSPKVVITTNYTIEGKGGSHERRKWEVELSSHFGALHTPVQEFGRELFAGWDDEQWGAFNNFMVDCLALYLKVGLYECSWESMHIRKFINATSPEFWEWIDEGEDGTGKYTAGTPIYRGSQMEAFVAEYPDWGRTKYNLTARRWVAWLEAYGEFKGWETTSGKNHIGHYTQYVKPGGGVDQVVNAEVGQGEMPF